MLEIYIGKENLPKDLHLIYDVDAAFYLVPFTGTDFQRKVISEIDKGTYRDERTFIDRFGCPLPADYLCSGTKSLLLLDSVKDSIVNFTECGENALVLLSNITDGKLYLESRTTMLPHVGEFPVMCNGEYWERISQLNYWLC